MFHLANGAAMYALMLSGGTNVVIRAFTPEGVMQAIERYRVNEILLVPTMIQMLVDHPAIGAHDLSSLRAHRVRRLTDERGAARPRGGRAAADAVRAGLRHDRVVAGGDHPAPPRAGRRRPQAGPPPLRRTRHLRRADPHRGCRRQAGAARHGRRDLRQRRRGDDGILGTPGGDREGGGRWLDAHRRRRLDGSGRVRLLSSIASRT